MKIPRKCNDTSFLAIKGKIFMFLENSFVSIYKSGSHSTLSGSIALFIFSINF